MELTRTEKCFLNLCWSAGVALLMFIFTSALLHALDKTDLTRTEADVGVVALILFFVITFVTTHFIIIEGELK